jgi:hypothetical protein
MASLNDPHCQRAVLARLADLRPDTPAHWGRMNAHQMVCHLADAFRFALGERPSREELRFPIPAPVARLVALYTPFPWPKGAPTLPEFDQEQGGTPPDQFAADLEELESLISRFVAAESGWPRHPIFGFMSRGQWGRWAFRHTDHHLRQFGV